MIAMTTERHFPDFAGKHVMFREYGKPGTTHLLEDVVFETKDGVVLVVGRYSEGLPTDSWVRGLVVGIAWNSVLNFTVFDSADDYRTRLTTWNRRHKRTFLQRLLSRGP